MTTVLDEHTERLALLERLRTIGSDGLARDAERITLTDLQTLVEGCEAQHALYAQLGLRDAAAGV